MAENLEVIEKRGVDGRKIALFFVTLALLLSVSAVYFNYRFTPQRGALQQRLQDENQQLIQSLRARITALRTRANGATLKVQLDRLSQRLDEAAALPATKYQQVGQACSEVAAALPEQEQIPSESK